MPRTRARDERLSQALLQVRFATGLLYRDLAARLSMSARTLARFTNGEQIPTRTQALAMLVVLNGLPPELYAQLADALGVEEAMRPILRGSPSATHPPGATATGPINRPVEEAAVTLMLYRAAEANGVAPAAARNIALATLDYVTERGFDLATARDVARAAVKG